MTDPAAGSGTARAGCEAGSVEVAVPLIRAEGLVMSHRRHGSVVPVLRGVDLLVQCGEFVAVTGPIGAGKSTLLRVLAGLQRPDGGRLWLAGERLDDWSHDRGAAARRHQIGLVLPSVSLRPEVSVAQSIERPVLWAGGSPSAARERRAQVLSHCGLQGRERCLPGDLTAGERLRVALARAMVHHPALLLVDEPAERLDTAAARDALRVLSRLHEEGQTIVMVTQDARTAGVADRVVSLFGGRVADDMVLDAVAGARSVGVSGVVELSGYRPWRRRGGRPRPLRLP
ncbi:ABC transporter ATP-binding protein [Streptomyces sp. NPDC001635]